MIVQDALPGTKRSLKPAGLRKQSLGLVIRCVAAFGLHFGRMSGVQAAGAVRSQPRHRAQIGRFLERKSLRKRQALSRLPAAVLANESMGGRFAFLIDQTLCRQQGDKTENTYSTGNRKRRPREGVRHSKYKHTRNQCHGFVMGLLITPSGFRIPFRRCYYPKTDCGKKGLAYRKPTELAADLIGELPLPPGTAVVVLGDTAFDAQVIQVACARPNSTGIVPINPERVSAGAKPRPQVRLLANELTARPFPAIRLDPNAGTVAMRRRSKSRVGPKLKPRIYYAHSENRDGHSGGKVRLVFSTREKPQVARMPDVQKILMTNDLSLSRAEVVGWYDLRWQIELFFEELKGTLGFAQYRFRRFDEVEGWLEMTVVTLLDLECYRARQLTRPSLSAEEKERWRYQRTDGLCLALRRETERADLEYLADALQTKGGIRRRRKQLAAATQTEYRMAL